MSWRETPNASHFSARYAERKMAQRRAALDQPRTPDPCLHCGTLEKPVMKIMCATCETEYRRIARADGIDAADDWMESGPHYRKLKGEP